MSKKSIAFLILLIILPVIIYFLWPSDEARIKKLFREGAKAVEARKAEDVMSKVSFNYSDEHGLSYITLKQAVERTLKEMSGIQVEYDIKGITIKDKNASAELDLRVIATYGKDTGYVVGDAARPAHLTFSLEKERTNWQITKVEGLKVEF
ncbi:MAG: hypothetical protein M0Z71_04100 [Nitrospiraceae bacterium]|nr:hypothetical protein [Nitrospiraceae bacterium]MDA8433407.1 hypothetical protein [Nitrospiraceae bacterium]